MPQNIHRGGTGTVKPAVNLDSEAGRHSGQSAGLIRNLDGMERDRDSGFDASHRPGMTEVGTNIMPQNIHRGIKSLIEEANAQIETLSAAEAIKASQADDVVIVDIRDPREIERDGRIPNAFSCTRGMLEFWIDPSSPYAKPIFQQDKKFIFHCAGGMRSALAAKTAQDMGLKPVAHIAGGFAAWRDAGGPTEKFEPKKKS
jgi:rhodanese-related sulfurtransferase